MRMSLAKWMAPVVMALLATSGGAAQPTPPAPQTSPAPARMLVICSPGSPGTTAQAQPTLDAFAAAAGKSAGWPSGTLGAIYFESADAGIARLREPDAALAMVPLPFLIAHGSELSLAPRLSAVAQTGPSEVWSLVAKKGSVAAPASLDGWEVTGTPGYAAGFVRGAILSGWGPLPEGAKITFTPRPLGALRRAAAGEKVAVILDAAQTAALASLPFAPELEVIHTSRPLPGGYFCTVGDRLPAAEGAKVSAGLARLHETDGGKEILKTMRMTRFEPVDREALEEVRRLSSGTGSQAP
ncbi:MAG TPA: PhnD/SsuA/transferrin family substrate-binding protein [Candidatus Polarisedimenticolia bacterium]|jgi:hypothetical protein